MSDLALQLRRQARDLLALADQIEQTESPEADPLADLIPIAEAAQSFRRSKESVRRWVRDRGLGVMVGGRLHVSKSRLAQFVIIDR